MYIEIALGLVILIQFALIVYLVDQIRVLVKEMNSSNRDYMKAIIAKNLTDLTSSTIAEQNTDSVKSEEDDLIPLENISDEDFTRALRKESKEEN